jgi:hypothetical protein
MLRGLEGLFSLVVVLVIFFGVVFGIAWFVGETRKDYLANKNNSAWIDAHTTRIAEINGRDTSFLCDDGTIHHKHFVLGR